MTKQEALISALFLAITAPDEEKKRECVAIADSLAKGMQPRTIARCKSLAARAAQTAKLQFLKEKAAMQ